MRPVEPTAVATPPPLRLVWDDFESGGLSGGSGWLNPWNRTGPAAIRSDWSPYQGTYHVELRGAPGRIERAANLSGQTNVRLQFWAKTSDFEPGEIAVAMVSPDGTSWTPVRTWVDGEDDNVYRFEDIDLSSFTMTSEFWVAFEALMSGGVDYFWVDDIKLVGTW